jgi:hypothetical protein
VKSDFSPPARIYVNNTEIKVHHPLKEVLANIKTREVKPFVPIHKIHKSKED